MLRLLRIWSCSHFLKLSCLINAMKLLVVKSGFRMVLVSCKKLRRMWKSLKYNYKSLSQN